MSESGTYTAPEMTTLPDPEPLPEAFSENPDTAGITIWKRKHI
jgi:hypothetical protein